MRTCRGLHGVVLRIPPLVVVRAAFPGHTRVMWEPKHIEEAVAALTRKLEGAREHGVKESAPIVQALEEAIIDMEAVRAPRHHDARLTDTRSKGDAQHF